MFVRTPLPTGNGRTHSFWQPPAQPRPRSLLPRRPLRAPVLMGHTPHERDGILEARAPSRRVLTHTYRWAAAHTAASFHHRTSGWMTPRRARRAVRHSARARITRWSCSSLRARTIDILGRLGSNGSSGLTMTGRRLLGRCWRVVEPMEQPIQGVDSGVRRDLLFARARRLPG